MALLYFATPALQCTPLSTVIAQGGLVYFIADTLIDLPELDVVVGGLAFVKDTETFYARCDTTWEAVGGGEGAAWGDITGTLASQTDLQSALNGKQPLDSDLTTIAGLTATTDNFMVAAASAWASRTPAQAKTSLALVKGDVGLSNVDNTTDAAKPVSTAQQSAFDLKAPLASPTFTGTVTGVTKAHVGLGSVDNTTDAGKPVSTATQTALNLKANLASPTFTGTVTVPGLTVTDATDFAISATTGSKIGQSGSKLGFFGVTPAVRPIALTQTYSTASTTHANQTQLAAPAGGTGATAGAYNTAANRDLMIASVNAARTDITNLKNFVNQIVDQLQALGLLQ